MKKLLLVLTLAISPAFAQTAPTNIYGGGATYNPGGSPKVGLSGLYARLVTGTGTYAFTVADFIPLSLTPSNINFTEQFGVGIAQKIVTIGKVPIFIPTSAGVSFSSSGAVRTGWEWNTGAMAVISIKGNWKIMPAARVLKSSVAGQTGYTPMVSIFFGWGK